MPLNRKELNTFNRTARNAIESKRTKFFLIGQHYVPFNRTALKSFEVGSTKIFGEITL